MNMKTCSKCGTQKSVVDFWLTKRGGEARSSKCKMCKSGEAAEWRKRNPEAKRAHNRKSYAKHRFSAAIAVSRSRGYAACNSTVGELESAFNGRCHVCGVPERECKRRLNMDHDHETGEFRGWLCDNCNRAMGFLKNSPEIIMQLALYAEKHLGVCETPYGGETI